MLKKMLIAALALLMVLCVGCGKGKEVVVDNGDKEPPESQAVEPTPIYYTNNLTGEKNLTLEESKKQPVAIMINNISIAQPKQTGVNKADIVYETEVEGGITRLMAVFKNIDKVSRVGTIRSARYVYVDLALGHKAVYLHCGQDGTYCAPHLKDIEHYTVDTGNAGKRIKNGLASEHTLYADGIDIYNTFMKNKTLETLTAWQNFSEDSKDIFLDGGAANSVTVPFSNSYTTVFNYDSASGKYIRHFRGSANKDYVTGETTNVKNVFVLLTSITNYSDGYHKNVSLQGGDGYYLVNGTYTPIKWTKGAANNSFKFTNTDGTALTVNQGNSWVCITNKSNTIGIQ